MSTYSNARSDVDPSNASRLADEGAVREMYEAAPYPDLGAHLKDLSLYLRPIEPDLARRAKVRFLDAGCGTGHVLVGVAKRHPDWDCFGIDLSDASLAVAKQLSDAHRAPVTVRRGSYVEPLPFDGRFDVVSAMGTIHHAADPVAALRNLRHHMRDDGYLLLHLYGLRCDRRKFDIKEALSILEPDLSAHTRRFDYYRSLMEHRRRDWIRRVATTTLADVYTKLRNLSRNAVRRGRGISWSPPFHDDYRTLNAPWIDHFCHPCERAYEVPEVHALLQAGGFRVERMLGQGKEDLRRIPAAWRERYGELGDWEKWRLTELMSEGGTSFALIARPGT